MHELSIAMNIVEIAEEECFKSKATSIQEIELEVGSLSGVVIEALEFALSEAIKGSLLENSNIKIISIQGKAACLNCKTIFQIENLYDECPSCKGFKTEIIEGKELRINSLLVD